MSTDRATGGDDLVAEGQASMEGGSNHTHAQDEHDDMVDKLRSDNFKGMVNQAKAASQQQDKQTADNQQAMSELCLGSDGSVTRADPTTAYQHLGKQRAAAGYGTHDSLAAPEKPSEDDDLKAIRAARMAAMQQEKAWRVAGHGKLRELKNEADFIGVVRPRERAIVLLSDSTRDKEAPEMQDALVELAKKHVEAQFCYIEVANAGIMTTILNLDEGLPCVFVCKYGQVDCSLPPARLFQHASASSPMFKQRLAALLRQVGGIGSGVKDADSDSDVDEDEKMERRRVMKRF